MRLVAKRFAGLVLAVLTASTGAMAQSYYDDQACRANSPSAVQAVKRQVSATIADHALTREAFEQELGDAVRTSPHFAEGIAAFREKRPPRYE